MKNTIAITIPAAQNGQPGVYNLSASGRYFKCLTMTGAFTVSTGGEALDIVNPGDGFGDRDTRKFSRLTFANNGSAAITAKVFYGDEPCTIATTAVGSNAATFLYGNMGIANGGNANLQNSAGGNTNVACDANGYLGITNAVNILIPGTTNGHRRQVLLLSIVSATVSNIALNVLDSNLLTIMSIPAGSPPVALVTDSDVYLSGAGGTAKVTVGQILLNN